MHLDSLSDRSPPKSNRILAFLISIIGAIIVSSAILHVSFTQVIPLTQLTAGFIIIIPAFFIGLINDDIRDSFLAMALSVFGTIILTSFTRALPAFVGIFPGEGDFFAFQQVASTIPMIFLLVPVSVIGTMIGVVVNEFLIKSRYNPN
ncbi:MAG: hypothetical protein ACFFB5_03940 [Promethearchaeota archaeon]